MRYLLVTHIPFARQSGDTALVDGLWAIDLKALVASVGPVSVAAPEMKAEEMQAWGPSHTSLNPADGITFIGLPKIRRSYDFLAILKTRSILRAAVEQTDLVHSSNFFHVDVALYHAHDVAVKMGKKTLFVVAEDFYDMQLWEWIRPQTHWLKIWRARRMLAKLDRHVQRRVRTSSLTFLHTPAAVSRYRTFAANAVAIRQPLHEKKDVIGEEAFAARCARVRGQSPLILCAACRMESLKGMGFVVRAVSILKQRGVDVVARLYGRGSEVAALEELAARLDVSDRISFPGAISPAEKLRAALEEGDIFLMPHLTNDFGRAFFDGIAAGCPVIAFRSEASEDTVRHEVDGLITPNADDEGLATGIGRLHFDRELLVRLSEAARTRALDNTKSFWNSYRTSMIQGLFASSAEN